MSSRIIIFSAPSGSGKSSIIKELLKEEDLNLAFSISTTSRIPRGKEQNGVEYYFISVDEFKEKIDKQAFIEWQEVYAGNFYGTYQSEIDRLSSLGKNIVFDLDVFGRQALSIFIQPPSLEELKKRLEKRNTETIEKIQIRIDKAKYELEQSIYFDRLIINEDLSESVKEASQMIRNFLKDSEL